MTALRNEQVALPDGTRLALRRADGLQRPFLLVHGLASNARLWDAVAGHLATAGHEVVAVDLRGHGRSERPASGYDTATSAADLAVVCDLVGLSGARAPVAVGQSWGGNVVLTLAAEHPTAVAAVALVDGGWITLGPSFATFDDAWSVLAPPRFDGMRYDDLAARIRGMHPDWPPESVAGTLANLERTEDGGVRSRLAREHHREILRSLYDGDPAALYPAVRVPVLLVPAGDATDARKRQAVERAQTELPDAAVRWYDGADHDLHAQHPESLAADLLALAARTDVATP